METITNDDARIAKATELMLVIEKVRGKMYLNGLTIMLNIVILAEGIEGKVGSKLTKEEASYVAKIANAMVKDTLARVVTLLCPLAGEVDRDRLREALLQDTLDLRQYSPAHVEKSAKELS